MKEAVKEQWLNFITFNAVAPIHNLHEISDAGAGEGLMSLHPTRDTELIACGKANTLLREEYLPSPVLGNGSVTPAILVFGIFKALQKLGIRIRLHCYQLGLDSMPDFSGCQLDETVVHHCKVGDEARLIREQLLPELKRQYLCGEDHLIAESGIGGTAFATLWLRRWVDTNLWFAGSTKDQHKLATKKTVIQELEVATANLATEVEQFVASTNYSDPVQRACCALLQEELPQINFAGGAMIFAPIIAMSGSSKVQRVNAATTKWVMQSPHSLQVAKELEHCCNLHIPKVNFHNSKYQALRMYEQGYVIEGCGLGACLDYAERHGLQGDDLINSMDTVVEPWL